MTTHKYPAVLPPQRQQAIEDATRHVRDELTQAHVSAAEWQRQCEQMSASLRDERAAHEATKRELKAMQRTAHAIADERTHVAVEWYDAQRKVERLFVVLARAIRAAQSQSARADVAERRLGEALMREGAGDE